ncbi:MAG: NCS2 family permease [Firmicutes bacterium]|nr:NCS2 family permease [Bacillota bacterium]
MQGGWLERKFALSANRTTMRTEVLAGLTTFMTMAYIIFVNPSILKDAGMDFGAVMVATCLSSAAACLIMGLYANYPIALAPGMGINAFFAYTVVKAMGYSWQAALAAVFVDGVLTLLLLTMTGAREAIINSVPMSLKLSISAGIGLFLALIGLQNAGIVVPNPVTLVQLGDFSKPEVLLAAIGLVITGGLVVLRVRGALLLGIIATTLIGIPMGVTKTAGFRLVSLPPSLAPTFGAFVYGLKDVLTVGMITIVFTFIFVDLFDTVGTIIGVTSKAGMLDEKGRLPRANRALYSDTLGTVIGSILGTSCVTSYIESASGMAEGGRTGLTAVVVAILFILATFFAPLVGIVPAAATAPVLVIVGVFMIEPIMKIDFGDYLEAIPAFLALAMMPFTYSIAEGIIWGVLSYVILHAVARRFEKISVTMWILAAVCLLRFFVH